MFVQESDYSVPAEFPCLVFIQRLPLRDETFRATVSKNINTITEKKPYELIYFTYTTFSFTEAQFYSFNTALPNILLVRHSVFFFVLLPQ